MELFNSIVLEIHLIVAGKATGKKVLKGVEITLHSFRRFVKTTISELGYADFSEWFRGHSGSTYWTKKDSEKAEIFRKIEPYLTFLNIPQLGRQGGGHTN